ncbi:ABC transporter ATP-binding protein [Pseudonocardia sp. KRD-184]|uniref:ABC transporter ATP-binding protein n=1 Tax=Pseudonocardia oceani TaxID=2792013 RepID=A0ABS6UF47_9PSEU|nr:ABC transporter ATP-binding protein [Pseudonocardia oceani]MBW0089164.1 ABC transporter ATP-binding protein [Pseudonocardia oceani]MBW0096109.1 ABC transporter ATP-binding protein [Pseudonocardia oceani]MBW0109597.1 ABC transporter ATP-binding protein [Pseudonocardia oceani]MBW0120953.1 ABC transporter ATP-binding protein [Pseudonocardia oceani]MBW0130860.1 ABC transporter ATP-binding protein [Pseudonocardia oceani]
MTSTLIPPVTLEVEDLVVEVLTEHGWATVVDGVSFAVARGETLGIVGESGSGKSVTCLSIAGLMPPRQTRVRATTLRVLDHDLTGLTPKQMSDVRGPNIAMIFQEPMTSLNPAFTVGDQIAEVLRRHEGLSRKASWARAVALLERVGVPDPGRRARQYPFEFSGGMRQRVMIAIALACNPDVIIADEPTTALDVTVQAQILELLREIQREHGMSVIVITHDLGVVADVCDRVLVMYAGQIVEGAPVDDLFEHPRHPYMEGLLAAMPRMDQPAAALESIPGSPPRVGGMPEGCRFHPRCRYAQAECRTGGSPVLERPDPDRPVRCLRHRELTLRGTA